MVQSTDVQTSYYSLEGMTCNGCVNAITDKLLSLQGIRSVDVSLYTKSATIRHTELLELSTLSEAIAQLGSYRIADHTGIPLQIISQPPTAQTSTMSLTVLKPLLIALTVVTLIAIALQIPTRTLVWERFLPDFMGSFFFIFSLFKLANIKGFSSSFKRYDVLAKYVPFFAPVYPFIELILGFCYLSQLGLLPINVITLIVMTSQNIGITRSLIQKTTIQCACLGSTFNIPITPITLLENIVMSLMALGMIVLSLAT